MKLLLHRSLAVVAAAVLASACARETPADTVRASGYVEATEVQVSPQVGGRLLTLGVDEGDRVESGQLIAEIDTTDTLLALRRARAERDQAEAQLQLLLAGARVEDIGQAEAQLAGADADLAASRDDLSAAQLDFKRFDSLLQSKSGSEKQRDDAATRRDVATARVRAAEERVRAAREALDRLKAGARPQEIQAARARVAIADAQIATLEQNVSDASLHSPVAGIVTQKFADAGETLAPRTPIVAITDLDHAWANVYIDEPQVPRVRLGQSATIHTDAGGQGISGKVTFISPKAEFTPRNVQTAAERSKLVYRIKITVDNSKGTLKQGMPVEAAIPLGTPGSEQPVPNR
jgi:HlyD family secretion protein